jgi:alpha-galactosidase
LAAVVMTAWSRSAPPARDPLSIIHEVPPEPAIHGPRIVGTTPGRPFIFLIPATGEGPLSHDADGLPAGLILDAATGVIGGAVEQGGTYLVKLRVNGPRGEAARNLNIVAGPGKLALTPPMGWNSWNVWGLAVDDGKVRDAADVMVSSGLAAHGFQYVNLDDGWENGRAEDGSILTNDKFPDLTALGGYIHSQGLRLGIYSSPGPQTCGHYEGSLGHEAQDAAAWAKWGVDYIKYDWCSYQLEVMEAGLKPMADPLHWFKAPYAKLGAILGESGRDVVYSICFYGLWWVETWGPEVGGNLWRTSGDITDTWASMSLIGFNQDRLAPYAGPGHWNDPDMLVVGQVGWGPSLHQTRLTPDEQITHLTLWSMLAAPLLIGCDMTAMDGFTRALLTNPEVIDVDQDPLGVQARRQASKGKTEVWARPLWDGTQAVALFNRADEQKEVTARWADLDLAGPQPVRDLWLHQDLGNHDGSFAVTVPAHGAVMVKIGAPERDDFIATP